MPFTRYSYRRHSPGQLSPDHATRQVGLMMNTFTVITAQKRHVEIAAEKRDESEASLIEEKGMKNDRRLN